jgi:hypothetical protein
MHVEKDDDIDMDEDEDDEDDDDDDEEEEEEEEEEEGEEAEGKEVRSCSPPVLSKFFADNGFRSSPLAYRPHCDPGTSHTREAHRLYIPGGVSTRWLSSRG